MNTLIQPLLAAVSVAVGVCIVFLLSALYQRYQFRQTGDPPVTTFGRAFLNGALGGTGVFVSNVLANFWNPPLWQKVAIAFAALSIVLVLLKRFEYRIPARIRQYIAPRDQPPPASEPSYKAGQAAARWLKRVTRMR